MLKSRTQIFPSPNILLNQKKGREAFFYEDKKSQGGTSRESRKVSVGFGQKNVLKHYFDIQFNYFDKVLEKQKTTPTFPAMFMKGN